MPYDASELEALMVDTEADWVERKESWRGDAPDKSRQAVCAFANDLPDHRKEGVLFLGVADDGRPMNLAVDDRLLQTLSDVKTDGQILPPPSMVVQRRTLCGVEVAVIHVRPSDSPPVRYSGRVWVRVGPRRAIATIQEERILAEKRMHRDKPFDIRPSGGASLADLDANFFEQEYLPSAFSPDVLQANGRSLEERLAALKMVTSPNSPNPTNLAQLVLGVTTRDFLPGAYVQFLRMDGLKLSDSIIDEAVIDGRADEVVRRCEDKLAAHNTTSVDLTSGEKEQRSSQYPIQALQQIVRNAIMHRTYEASNAPIRVTWFKDRIEVQSPGGPYGVVSQENFGRPGVTDYRNPNLSESLKVLGFVQRFGVGIATARELLHKNGNPPLDYEVNESYVTAIIRART